MVVLDTETTGLSNSSRIVELAALEVEPLSGRVLRRLHHLVNPGMPIPAAATKIHGLRNTDVANKPVFAEIAQELADFVRGATIAAQNATFDRRMLESELLGAGQPSLSALGVRVVDTVAVSRGLFPLLERHTLDHICDHLGIDRRVRRTHGALIDAQLLADALSHFAAAYRTWCVSAEDSCNDAALTDRELQSIVDIASNEAENRHAEAVDRTFARVAIASSWADREESALLAGLSAAIGPQGWCSKNFSARWLSSESTSWKDAANAYLGEGALRKFRSELRFPMVSARTIEDATLSSELETLTRRLAAMTARPTLSLLADTALRLRAARKRLEALRAKLRAQLLDFSVTGFQSRYARVREVRSMRTDYRAAVTTIAPAVDLGPFTSCNRHLGLHARNLRDCALLFGDGRDATAGPAPRLVA
ncbi:MAG: hypothetical protein JO043_05690 [Candidatus Eremiobacteraeota bacterium]|nr:hypothetical protein [Candidatus Eremiobacteraeota bacterium]